ncbi:hypothetical protein ES319_D10G134600v1 [Gossypium barbadense]|uniref:Uncharacterized protein n=3 Tax=Gossypium TaxID=3633 RepID=A0A5J5PRA3_GOSBA|nr:hypothetical protein ES319_D10G134600v1 [Gossypium barbadense]PPD89671.1 hypothetical protein GOBAR_DD13401 [Gossypium barbadense]TYG50029.1 hypothetical protein ES288_D10G143200v1 [Gossypium darwinii]
MENSISPQEKMIINMWKPSFLTSFVDTFVDLSISGLILPKHDHQQIPQKPLQTHYPSPSCVVATGGLHGDLEKTMQAFRLGGLIDGSNYWFGASTTVVQIGDVLKILYFLKMLKLEAVKNGGQTDNFEWQS